MQVTKENYFSNEVDKEYMSNSQFKSFLDCEAKTMSKLNGEWPKEDSTAFLQGRYVHSWNEGTTMQFEAENPEMIAKSGKNKGGLKKEFLMCGDAIDMLSKDELILKALQGEKEVIFTADLYGTKWKCMHDSYNPKEKRFADLKYLKGIYDKFWNTEESYYENPFDHYGYYTQLSLYAEIERIASGRKSGDWFEPFLVVATKQTPPDKMIISFQSDENSYKNFIRSHILIVQNRMPRILKVKSGQVEPTRCGVCDYCRATKVLKGTTHYSKLSLY